MRKKIIISIILCAILFSISIVQAVTGVASLRAKSTSVKPGETFTVTLSVACEDGINGIDTTYSYDKEKLELINANVANNNWASLGSDNSITLISNTTSKITTSDVYVLTFKVKDNAKSGIAKISTNEIMIDSDLAENSSFTVSAKSVNINIVSESHSDDNTEDNNNINDNTENNNNVNDNTENNNNVNDNTENNNNVNDNTENNNNVSDNTENNNNVSNNTEKNNIGNNTSTDNTIIKNSKLPQTGIDSKVSTIVLAIVTVSIAIAIYSFVKIKSIKK